MYLCHHFTLTKLATLISWCFLQSLSRLHEKDMNGRIRTATLTFSSMVESSDGIQLLLKMTMLSLASDSDRSRKRCTDAHCLNADYPARLRGTAEQPTLYSLRHSYTYNLDNFLIMFYLSDNQCSALCRVPVSWGLVVARHQACGGGSDSPPGRGTRMHDLRLSRGMAPKSAPISGLPALSHGPVLVEVDRGDLIATKQK